VSINFIGWGNCLRGMGDIFCDVSAECLSDRSRILVRRPWSALVYPVQCPRVSSSYISHGVFSTILMGGHLVFVQWESGVLILVLSELRPVTECVVALWLSPVLLPWKKSGRVKHNNVEIFRYLFGNEGTNVILL
jgi:hypothetical protein